MLFIHVFKLLVSKRLSLLIAKNEQNSSAGKIIQATTIVAKSYRTTDQNLDIH